MAKKDDKSGKSKKKGKGAKKGGGSQATGGLSVAAHPRAAAQVRRAKGLGGLAVFALVAYLSLKANVPADQAALRAIAGGIAGYLIAWACAVAVWRQLVLAELKAAIEAGKATWQPGPDAGGDAAGQEAVAAE